MPRKAHAAPHPSPLVPALSKATTLSRARSAKGGDALPVPATATRAGPPPRYRQIADELRLKIQSGVPAVGSMMPTEIDLCETYTVSRHTAREALRVLADQGLIERRQGHGTRVVAAETHRWERSISTIPDLLQYGANTRLSILTSQSIAASREVAALLDVTAGTECMHLHGVRSETKTAPPFCVSDIYRASTTDELAKRLATVRGAVYAIIEELAVDHIGRVEQRISAGRLSAAAAKTLGVIAGDACLKIVRRYFDMNGEILMVAVNQHRADDFHYSMELRRTT
jgi:GntR family transcriptional regulator